MKKPKEAPAPVHDLPRCVLVIGHGGGAVMHEEDRIAGKSRVPAYRPKQAKR